MYTGSGYKYIIYVIVALLVAAAVSDPQLTSADKGTPSGSMGVNTVQSSGEKPISQLTPQGKGFDLNNYNLAQSPGIIMVMEKTSFILCQEIPDQVIIPAAIWIYTPGQSALWKDISVYDGNHRLIINYNISQNVKNTNKSPTSPGADGQVPALSQELQSIPSGMCLREITVPLKDPAPAKGQPSTLQVTARLIINGKTAELTLNANLILASLPSYQDWYCGDGHMHANFKTPGSKAGDDGWHSIAQVINMMKKRGYMWTVMTAHREAFSSQAGWAKYWADCQEAQAEYGIPVCPGTEIASSTNAHALAYWQDPKDPPPSSKKYPEAELITRITDQNPGSSYGGMAHPNHSYKWHTWPSNSRVAELISSSTVIDGATYTQWLAALRGSLPVILSSGAFCTPAGNSDYHFGIPAGCTWLYMPNYSSSQREPVWTAIKTGRTSASGRGNLGCFSLNGHTQGAILINPDQLEFKIVQKPVTGAHCEQFAIRNKNGENIWVSPHNPGENTVVNLPPPSEDDFYFVHLVFFHDKTGLITSDVITSPVFIDIN